MATRRFYTNKDASAVINSTGSFDAWSGHDNHVPVGTWGDNSLVGRGFFQFPIDFTGWTKLNSANLRMKQRPNSSGHCLPANGASIILLISRMLKDWGEAADRGEGLWSQNDPFNYSNRAKRLSPNGTGNWALENQVTEGIGQIDNAYTNIDITALVQDWWDNSRHVRTGAPNYGIIVINNNEDYTAGSSNKGIDFFSRDSGADNRAYVDVDFDTNQPPDVPVSLDPTGNSVVNNLLPTFSGTRDDPDGPTDYITAVSIEVRTDDLATVKWTSGKLNISGKPTSFSVVYGQSGGVGSSVADALSGNTYYQWRAKTWDKGGETSTVFSGYQRFLVNSTPNTPTVAFVDTPASDLTTLSPLISITHNDPDPGDTKMYGYQVIAQTSTGVDVWDSGNVDTSGAPVTTTNTPTTLLAWGTSYRAKARTKDKNGSWSGFSGWVPFTTHRTGVPINLSPTSDNITNIVPTFTASRSNSAEVITSYDLVVYSDDLATTPLAQTNYTTGISGGANISKAYAGSTLLAGAYYQWKIRTTATIAGDTGHPNTSNWSTLQRFRVQPDVTIPSPVAPIGAGGYSITPVFSFSRATTFNRAQYEIYPSTSTQVNLGTALFASATLTPSVSGTGPYTGTTAAYAGSPALTWNTQYKWRVRVSSDAGSTWSGWSGLQAFFTDVAATAINVTPAAGAWLSTAPTAFLINRGAGDTIDQMQVRVWNSNGTILIWDSGMTDVTNGTTNVSLTYAGPILNPAVYSWDARYQRVTNGAIGSYSSRTQFRINASPDVAANMFPTPSYVYADSLVDAAHYPDFKASFSDPDVAVGDTPHDWEIVIELLGGTAVATKTLAFNATTGLNGWTSGTAVGLVVGLNTYHWQTGDTTLAYNVQYRWKTRFRDSKLVWGPYTGYNQFKIGQSPNATITTPSNGTDINVITPQISWSFSGGTQQSFTVLIDHTDVDGQSLQTVFSQTVVSAATTFTVPAGFLHDRRYYNIYLFARNTDGLTDPTPSQVNVFTVLDAPDPITGFSGYVNTKESFIDLTWDRPNSLKANHTFVSYNIYRKLSGATDWNFLASSFEIDDTEYADWESGHAIDYQYRVSMVTTKSGVGIELESPDDPDGGNIIEVVLDSDVWMFIGADKAPEHIVELPVSDESHNRIVQQEAFETIGSDRKVVIRGFVLGYEGSISMTWMNHDVPLPTDFQVSINETVLGRRILDYLTSFPGPHILKSPFGDVWRAEFEGPQYKWLPAGHLQIDLNWTETGGTNRISL